MKKFSLLLSALAFLFFSCSENLENHDSKKSGNVTINISGAKNSGTYSSARFITPVESFDISQVKEWNVTFTPVTPAKAEKVTATLTPENGSVTATLGVGTYNFYFYIEGSYTISSDNGDTTVNLSGSKDGIVITEEKTAEFSVVVGLKKTAGGTGSFSVTFTFDDSDENGSRWATYYATYGTTTSDQKTDYSKGIKVVLTSNSDKNTEYSTENGYLTIDTTNAEDGKVLAVSSSGDKPIPSGFYNLSFFADYSSNAADDETTAVSVWQKITLNSDDLVEIADGQQTSGAFINLLFPTEYTYYASDTGKEDANGLTQTNPGTLYSVLKNIYANKNITSANINYTYSDTIKLDVSKIGSGKSISVSCTTDDGSGGDTPKFGLNPDNSVSYTMYSSTLNFFTTDDSKKTVSVASGSDGTVILSDGVYMDLTSLDALSQRYISMDVDNPGYYEANPVAVYKTPSDGSASISFNFTTTSNFSEYTSDSKLLTVFTYDTNTTLDSESGLAKVYAQEPYVYVNYYGNTSTVTSYVIGNDSAYFTTNSRSMASWCDDKNGGFYVFEAETESNALGNSPAYNLVHYKKIQKGASFILDKESVGTSVTTNVPVSVCTDGSNIYFVESALDISSYNGKSLDLGAWGSWAHKGCTVKYFSIASPSAVNELDFSSVFTGGKVTAVYHYNNGLYVAGYSRKSLGTVTVTSDNGSEKTEFFDSTFSVYKLADATDVSGAALVKDVFSNSTEDKTRIAKILNSSSTSSEDVWTAGDTRVKSYNAITDMAIMDGKFYVLENSYYYGSSSYYGSKGSLRQFSLESGSVTLIDKCDSDSTDTASFKVPNKILAVLPKKLKLIIADSGGVKAGTCYTVDLSDADKISVSGAVPSNASGHNFDNYSTGSDFFNSSAFTENSYYTSKASFEEYDE